MRNFTAKGDSLTLTALVAVAAGGGALIGSIFGVAKQAVAVGARGVFELVGCYDLAKDANAVTEGAKAYWDNTAKVVTATAGANTPIGVFTAARAAGAATANVRLNASF